MRRSRRRNRKRMRLWLLLPVVAALACLVLCRFVFVVRSVEVQGNTGALGRDDVVRAANVDFGGSIFRVDSEAVGRSVAALGALKVEDVKIVYPHTISLQVRPRNREAMILHMGKIRILDEEGCIVESRNEVPDMDLVYVSGMKIDGNVPGEPLNAAAGQLEAYIAAIRALNANGADIYVSELNVENPNEITILTRTGIIVKLGDAGGMNNKIAWMKSAVADLEQRSEMGGTLDVSSGTKADYRSAR